MKRLFFILCLCCSCAQLLEKPPELTDRQPSVLSLEPREELISLTPEIRIRFSRRLDETTVKDSIGLVVGKIPAVEGGDFEGVMASQLPLHFSVIDEGRTVLIRSDDPLKPETDYTLVVTPRLLSEDRLPFSQDPLKGAVPFLQVYRTLVAASVIASEVPEALPTSVSSNDSTTPPTPSSVESPSATPPETGGGALVINEILYDAVGSDTDGLLFVELFGTAAMEIGGYQIRFIKGDGQEHDSITLPEGSQVGSDGFFLIADARTGQPTVTQVHGADLIDNFDPQNGPDAVQLVDPAGGLVDAVGYGEGIVTTAENGLPAFEGGLAPDVPSGHSLERTAPGADSGDNASDFVDRETPTPRR